MTRAYYRSRSCPMEAAQKLKAVFDRAPRPYTGSELAEITGLPMPVILGFLVRNTEKGTISARIVPRVNSTSGKPQREYWRGSQDLIFTFGRGKIITDRQARELAQGKRPMQWREAGAVWSLDETGTVAVRRGYAIVCMGKAERVDYRNGDVTLTIKDGPEVRFEVQKKETET